MPYKKPRRSKYQFKTGRSYAGLGLFAETDIKRKEFLIEYFGPLLKEEEANKKGGKYLFDLENGKTIDGSLRENKARYINHSCRPNADVEVDGNRIYIYSIRKIKKGEEITYDYGKEYFKEYIKPFGCRCGNHRKKRS